MKRTIALTLALGLILGTVATAAETVTYTVQGFVACDPDDPEVPDPM